MKKYLFFAVLFVMVAASLMPSSSVAAWPKDFDVVEGCESAWVVNLVPADTRYQGYKFEGMTYTGGSYNAQGVASGKVYFKWKQVSHPFNTKTESFNWSASRPANCTDCANPVDGAPLSTWSDWTGAGETQVSTRVVSLVDADWSAYSCGSRIEQRERTGNLYCSNGAYDGVEGWYFEGELPSGATDGACPEYVACTQTTQLPESCTPFSEWVWNGTQFEQSATCTTNVVDLHDNSVACSSTSREIVNYRPADSCELVTDKIYGEPVTSWDVDTSSWITRTPWTVYDANNSAIVCDSGVEESSEPGEACTDPDANNVGQPLPCTYNPPVVCEPEDYNGDEEGCGVPPVVCDDQSVPIDGICPIPTEPPVVCEAPAIPVNGVCTVPTAVVPLVPPKTPLEVPTCEEMANMDYQKFLNRWPAHWEKLECTAKGYQTGAGGSSSTSLLVLGLVILAIGGYGYFRNVKKQG